VVPLAAFVPFLPSRKTLPQLSIRRSDLLHRLLRLRKCVGKRDGDLEVEIAELFSAINWLHSVSISVAR